MAHVISQVAAPEPETIDREKVCPLLLRIFTKLEFHNKPHEYNRGSTPSNELQIYTWLDCTLRELVTLIKDVNPEARKKGTEYNFAIVSAHHSQPRYILREVGVLQNGNRGVDDAKTLAQCKFEVGDYIDVAIIPPAVERPFRNGADRRQSFDRLPGRRFNGFRD